MTVVAVTKTHPPEAALAAYAAGLRVCGENRVQELVEKREAIDSQAVPGLHWHLIGHLQRNKARLVVPLTSLVHTVDTPELALELSKRFHGIAPESARLPVLVEVSIAGEEQKHGVAPPNLTELLASIEALPALSLRGLMCVPPFTEDPAGARPFFDELRRLRELHGGAQRLPELSMGMTHDLEQAVAAGATLVRVGTAIFGARAPND